MLDKIDCEFKFAVVGFPGAGKSTYAAALYRACDKTGYKIVRGESYLKGLAANLDASKEMPASQKGETTEVAFDGRHGRFCFKDYAGEKVVSKKTGEVTPNFCSSIIGDSVGALILINPLEVEKRLADRDIELCVSRYDPIIKYLAESKHLRSVAVVRTAHDYYRSMGAERQKQFDDFEKELRSRLDAANARAEHKFALVPCNISCKIGELEGDELFLPFRELINKIGRCEGNRGNRSGGEGESKQPIDRGLHKNKSDVIWLLLLGVFALLVAGLLWWKIQPRQKCQICQTKLVRNVKDGLCDDCRKKTGERKNEIDDYKDVLKQGRVTDCIDRLNDLSDDNKNEECRSVSEECSRMVTREFSRIVMEMKKQGGELKEYIRTCKKMVGSMSWNGVAIDNTFRDFSELSIALGNTRNDTLKQNEWYVFVTNATNCKQLNMCADSFVQEYEICEISVKVNNNPYRWLTVQPSFFEYSVDDREYKLQEITNEIKVLDCESNCDWKSVWRGDVRCKGNPWRCCGVKLRFEGDNRWLLTGSGSADVVEIFDCKETLESAVEPFAHFKKKGPVQLSYRITCRRLKSDVKSPFAVEGGVMEGDGNDF